MLQRRRVEEVGQGSADVLPDEDDLAQRGWWGSSEVFDERREESITLVSGDDHAAETREGSMRSLTTCASAVGTYVKPSPGSTLRAASLVYADALESAETIPKGARRRRANASERVQLAVTIVQGRILRAARAYSKLMSTISRRRGEARCGRERREVQAFELGLGEQLAPSRGF